MRSLCYFSWVYLEIITDISALSAEVCGSSVRDRTSTETEGTCHTQRVALRRDAAGYITLSDLTRSSLVTANSSILLWAESKPEKKSQNINFFFLFTVMTFCLAFNLLRNSTSPIWILSSESNICSLNDKLCRECERSDSQNISLKKKKASHRRLIELLLFAIVQSLNWSKFPLQLLTLTVEGSASFEHPMIMPPSIKTCPFNK